METVEKIVKFSWDGDNREFVIEQLLPRMTLSNDVRQVIRWAYGYDGAERSYELNNNPDGIMGSDGATLAVDYFLGGLIKEPPAVGHDMLYILHHEGKTTPDGHIWTQKESDIWYKKAETEFGYPVQGILRRIELGLFGYQGWGRNNKKKQNPWYRWR